MAVIEAPRIYWIRHEPGHVRIDLEPIREPMALILEKLTGVSADAPHILRLAAEIAAADRSASVVAVLDHGQLRRIGEWLEQAHAYPVAPGIVLCASIAPHLATHKRGYLDAILLLGLYAPADAPDLVFQHVRTNATAEDLAPLLARYELDRAAADLPVDAPFRAELTLSITGAHLDVWPRTPPQRTRRFFHIWSHVAMVLQDLFRRWIRYEWLAEAARFEDHATGRALVAYWLSIPRAATSHSEFMYDVMEPQTFNRVCRSSPRMRAELEEVGNRIEACGMSRETAERYRGDPRKVLAAMRRDERSLRRLFSVDTDVFEHLINFAVELSRVHEARVNPESPLPHPVDLVIRFTHGLRAHLRRGPLPDWSHDLATLAVIEATNALRRGFRLPNGIRTQLRVTAADGREFRYETQALRHPVSDGAPAAETGQDGKFR
jgi:hypothetical protein